MSVKLMGMVFDAIIKPITIESFGGKQKTVQSSTLKFVLLAMSNAANDDGKGSYRSLTTLEKNTGLARSAVVFAVRALLEKKYLLKIGKSELGTTNYTINMPVLSEDYPSPQRGLGQSSARTSTSPQRGLNSSFNHPYPSSLPPAGKNGNGNGHRMMECVNEYQKEFGIKRLTKTAEKNIQQAHDHNPENWPAVLAWAAGQGLHDTARILRAAQNWKTKRPARRADDNLRDL